MPGKSVFADRRVDDSLRPETFEQALAYLVGAVVLRHFFAHEKDVRIAFQFFRKRLVQAPDDK